MMNDWELILECIRLAIEASDLPKWGHYEVINNNLFGNKEMKKKVEE